MISPSLKTNAVLNSLPSSLYGVPRITVDVFPFKYNFNSEIASSHFSINAGFKIRSSGGYPVSINSEKIIKSD